MRGDESLLVGRQRTNHDVDKGVADGVFVEELDGATVDLVGDKVSLSCGQKNYSGTTYAVHAGLGQKLLRVNGELHLGQGMLVAGGDALFRSIEALQRDIRP